MRATKPIIFAMLTAVGATCHPSPLEAGMEERAEMVVYTYNYAGDSAGDLASARQHAETIFRRANIALSWIDCRTTGRDDSLAVLPTCRTDLRPDEVMLRIQAGSAGTADRVVSLGFSWVNRENAGSAWLSSVFADRVSALASRTGIDPAVLLGRAIAHEIGHLLIGSTDHPTVGLMRAYWSQAQLKQNNSDEWVFLEHEARAMQLAVMTRGSRNVLARR